MTSAIKNEQVSRDGLCGDDVGVLRHISGSVDLSLVVDALSDTDLALRASESSDLYKIVKVRKNNVS